MCDVIPYIEHADSKILLTLLVIIQSIVRFL